MVTVSPSTASSAALMAFKMIRSGTFCPVDSTITAPATTPNAPPIATTAASAAMSSSFARFFVTDGNRVSPRL